MSIPATVKPSPAAEVTFEHLIEKVQHAEEALESHERHMGEQSLRLKQAWKAGWTPVRVLSAGLVSGFLVGRAEPLGNVGGVRWMQMITTLSGLFSSIQAAGAATDAEDAAQEAEGAAEDATGSAGAAPTGPRPGIRVAPTEQVRGARPHTGEWSSEPRPAEAATEVSERYTAR